MSALKICPQCGSEYELDQRFCPKDGTTLKLQGGTGDLVGSIIADRYHVLKKLGEGGMGTVYLAEHVKMGRKSAVKVMNPGMVNDADAISRFNREAANASKISHANVAAVYDFGETADGLTYLAMEFVEGPSLTKVIEDNKCLPPLRAADITRQASEALSVAHDMGIVHRDLKPDNIMLAKGRDGVDIVKVVDFGIAKAAGVEGQKVTKTGLVVGTPEYMSPEQLAGDKLDGRSDIYSLALVAFNMFTGKLPFPGETAQESMIARLTDSPKPLSELKPEVPWSADVQAVMDAALQRDVASRYQSAADFGRALFMAVQAMPEAGPGTEAHTHVMAPVAAGGAHPMTHAPTKAMAPPAVPPTRVGAATPHNAPASVPAAPAKSKAGLIGAIVGVVAIVGAAGTYMAMNKAGTTDSATGATGTPLNQPLAQAPAINVARELEDITSMPDSTAQLRVAILERVQKLDSAARLASDSTFARFRFLRARAILDAGDVKPGCDSLYAIEGKLGMARASNAGGAAIAFCRQQ